ncbi:MAG: gfo/Idh/MocA family oxidoreductase [Betaproteobacteria bacterium HGW-Betaproteobacteria-22]|nr:MAG: gfo/Idh/MocA family oxidoreductase [Betaproteobacteria bacterium HGW-Betaproteobacteria-22]
MIENRKLRWGILGAARVNERLLPAIIEAPNSQLVAIASRRAGAAKTALEKYAPQGFLEKHAASVQCYDDLDALIADANVEAIYCPMANEEHAQWALKAVDAGKHVLIEKPMALTVADIEAIEAAAKKNNVKVMEGFMYRFHPQHAKVRELIEAGLIGDALSCRASFSFLMPPARMYRINRSMVNGGGALWDIGPYAIHALRWCVGANEAPVEPISVIANAKLNEHGADTVMSGVLDFGQDTQGRTRYGHFDISFERARKAEYEIIGDKGAIKCHNMWAYPTDEPVISWEAGGKTETLVLPKASHFNLEIEHFSDCVLNDKLPYLTLADAKANARVMQAVSQSVAMKQLYVFD